MNLTRLNDKADLMLAAAVVGILMLMIIPIPARLLDMLLAFNITLSLVILLVAMYNLRALEFSAFPSLEGTLAGLPTHEPAFGLPATWILERDRADRRVYSSQSGHGRGHASDRIAQDLCP
jgi:flagellar biosynthesis component FlhA